MRLVPLLAARSPLAAGPALALPTPLVLGAASLSAFGLRDTGAGRTLTAPMLSFALCLGLSNIGLLPAASPAYELCWKRLLPLAVSLGLLSASAGAPRGSNDGELRPMLLAFGVGAVGTIVGAFVAFGACTRLGLYSTAQAAVAAALLAATYVGGSANFFGVASAVASPARDGSLVASLLAADLGLMAIYLLALTAAARSPPLRRAFPEATPGKYAAAVAAAIPPPAASTLAGALVPKQLWRVAGVGIALLACGAAAVVDHNVGLAGSGTLALCALSAAASRALPPAGSAALAPLEGVAVALSCAFLGALGASARLGPLVAAGPAAALFAAIVLVVHCAFALGGGRLANACGARVPLRTLLVASNANVGGVGTALAMATAMGWPRLLAPAAAAGTLGYAVATFIGVAVHAACS